MTTANKFVIRRKTKEQGNYTGRPWLVYLPAGQRYATYGWATTSADGLACKTFDDALAAVIERLNK